jgi:ABC-type glycerol-3-phosphate transport system permease component
MLAIPFCVWLLSAYFQRLSPEIEESAISKALTA